MSTPIRLVTDEDLPRADQENLIAALKQWIAEGTDPNPLIPALDDIDGDGIVDAYGLDGFGRLVYVSGLVTIDKTVLKSVGGEEEIGALAEREPA